MKRTTILMLAVVIALLCIRAKTSKDLLPSVTEETTALSRAMLSEQLSEKLHLYNVKRYLEEVGVMRPDIVIKQVVLETNWLKSKACRKYNNLFGMNYPVKRPTTASKYVWGDPSPKTGKLRKKAVYNNWKDSVDDYLLYQKYWISLGKDVSNYWHFLAQLGYSETSGYVQVLKSIKI